MPVPREGGRALVLPGSCDPRALSPLPLLYPRRRPLPPSGARAPLSTCSPNCINAPHARAQSPLARAPAKARKGSRRDGRSSPSVDWHANGVDRLLFAARAQRATSTTTWHAPPFLARQPASTLATRSSSGSSACLPACSALGLTHLTLGQRPCRKPVGWCSPRSGCGSSPAWPPR